MARTRAPGMETNEGFCNSWRQNRYWGAKWPHAQINYTQIQIICLVWVWQYITIIRRREQSYVNLIKKLPQMKRLLSCLTDLYTNNGNFGPRSRSYQPEAFPLFR